jgi:hypothetical protein
MVGSSPTTRTLDLSTAIVINTPEGPQLWCDTRLWEESRANRWEYLRPACQATRFTFDNRRVLEAWPERVHYEVSTNP